MLRDIFLFKEANSRHCLGPGLNSMKCVRAYGRKLVNTGICDSPVLTSLEEFNQILPNFTRSNKENGKIEPLANVS